MRKRKFYLLEKDRNEEEKKYNKASFASIIDRYFNSLILCNNIVNVDYELEDVIGSQYDEESEEYVEVFQYFIADINGYSIDSLRQLMEDNDDDSILLLYSNVLDVYVLAVTHFGTSWDYVPTSIELTENFEEM